MGLVRLVRLHKVKELLLSRFAIKSTAAGGLVYYTIQEGLWSKSEESVKLYEKVYKNVAPYLKQNLPKEVTQEFSQLPSFSSISNITSTYWNCGVMISMKFISELPTHTRNGVNNLFEVIQKYMPQRT